MTLRPVGTEFETVYPPSLYTSDVAFYRVVYRVVGHVRALRFEGDRVGVESEQIEVITRTRILAREVYRDGEIAFEMAE